MDLMRMQLLIALLFVAPFVARVEGLWVMAWATVKRAKSQFRHHVTTLSVVIKDGIPHYLYSDGTTLPVMGGGQKTLRELREEITVKQAALAEIFKEAGTTIDLSKVTRVTGTNEEKAAEIKRRNDELNTLVKAAEDRELVERTQDEMTKREDWLSEVPESHGHPGSSAKSRVQKKSIGELFIESKAFLEYKGGNEGPPAELDIEVKTLFTTTAGWVPEALRGPRVELTPERALVVGDLPSTTETSQNAVKYMEETTATKAATEIAEAGTYPEAAFVLTERSSPVQKIAVFIPVTDEMFEDETRARDYINNRLIRAVRERFDLQLLIGNSTPPNLRGILNVVGINTQAKGADPTFDAIYKGITLNRFTGFAEPDAIVMHPTDWQNIRLTRTADGIYILGNPGEAGAERLWGFPVVVTPAETVGTALIGAFRAYSEIAIRSGVQVQVTNAHSTFFIEGKLAVRADFRAALAVYRPKAFTTVTGL